MKRNIIKAEKTDRLGAASDSTNGHTMKDLSKEGIRIMRFRKFISRIGVALALSVAFGLMIGVVPVSFAQAPLMPGSPSVSINPTQGTTNPGGQTRFQINFQGSTGPGWQPTWNCSFLFMPPRPNGIDIRFSPVTVIVPPGQQRTAQATVTVANFVARATFPLSVRVNCTAAALNGAPLLYQQDFVYTLQVGDGGGPNPPPPGGTGPCQFNFAFDPPIGNLVQVQNTQDPMAWAWTAGFSIVASAQGNCPATSQFTARLDPRQGLFLMMQPPLYGPNTIPGRYSTSISARNSAGVEVTAVIEICATESVNRPWQCRNYNYQLRRGGGAPPSIRVNPTSVDFGTVAIGRTETRSITISNAGGTNVNYNAATTNPPGGSPFFVTGATAGVLRPGESATINVAFTPLAAGTFQINLVIRSNDSAQPTVSVPIRGIGSAGGSNPGSGPGPGSLIVQLSVDRGCGATYRIGDPIIVSFQASQDALVTLSLIRPDGSQQVLVANQPVRGGVSNSIQGMVGEPAGSRTLLLEAIAGQTRGRAECAFAAAGASTAPPTALQASISTDRGCQETGQNPIYSVGDPITVQFRVDGATQAFVILEDILPDGSINVILQQLVPGNVTLQLSGQIAPPPGRETLRLTVQVGQQTLVRECSFTVAG